MCKTSFYINKLVREFVIMVLIFNMVLYLVHTEALGDIKQTDYISSSGQKLTTNEIVNNEIEIGQPRVTLTTDHKLNVRIQAMNNIMDTAKDLTLVVGLYKKDESDYVKLVDIMRSYQVVEDEPIMMDGAINLPEDLQNYYAKIFVWDDIDKMAPLIKTFIIDDFNSLAAPVQSEPYQASTGFSQTQGKNNWVYQYTKDSKNFYEITNYTNDHWDGEYDGYSWCNIYADTIHPANNANAVRTFVAPYSGVVKLNSVKISSIGQNMGDGVSVKVMKGTTQIWPATGWQKINSMSSTDFPETNISVSIGDEIHFIINCNQSNGNDLTRWDPIITYESYVFLDLNASTLQLHPYADEATVIKASVDPTMDDQTISWTSSNTDVATVDNTGLVTPKKNGTTKITAALNNGLANVNCAVNVCDYQLSEDYSATKQGPLWKYMYTQDGSTVYSELTSDGITWGVSDGAAGTISKTQIVPGPNNTNTVVSFTSPFTGQISITSAEDLALVDANGDGVRVKVLKNNDTFWPNSGWQQILPENAMAFPEQKLSVVKGDILYFIVDCGASGNNQNDNLVWNPVIRYDNIIVTSNVALKKPAKADCQENWNPVKNGNDGDPSTRWCVNAGGTNHWWEVDLGTQYNIIGCEIDWELLHNYQYKIETSNNETDWVVVVDQTQKASSSKITNDDFSAKARYVRISITGPSGVWGSFYECKIMGYPDAETVSNSNIVSLYSNAADRYVKADENNGYKLIASRADIEGNAEKFEILEQADGKVVLKSLANNKYITAYNNESQLIANADSVGEDQMFTKVTRSDGCDALLSSASGGYMGLKDSNNNEIVASSNDKEGITQSFSIEYRKKESIDFDWKFYNRDIANGNDVNLDESTWKQVDVPHDFCIEGPFDSSNNSSQGYLPVGIGWYRKHFTVPQTEAGQNVIVQFDGVYENAKVYLNGKLMGSQNYGYNSFYLDLTQDLKFGEDNVLAVRVNRSNANSSRWYSGGGILRNVWLVTSNKICFRNWGTNITTPVVSTESAQVNIKTAVQNNYLAIGNKTCTLETTIYDQNKNKIASAVASQEINGQNVIDFNQDFTVINPMLWSTDTTNLYYAKSKISLDGQIIDSYTSSFGIRKISYDNDKGLFINDKNIKLKGICMHEDGGPVGAAVPEAVLERRLIKLKELGCNAIRTSHNPESPAFYDLCDKLGFLILDEFCDKWWWPNYPDFDTSWEKDLKNMIDRDRNHPCVLMWSVGNEVGTAESSYVRDTTKMLVDFIHQYEPTRRVVNALIPGTPGATTEELVNNLHNTVSVMDLYSGNYQEGWFEAYRNKYPDTLMMTTEAYDYFDGFSMKEKSPWFYNLQHDYVIGSFIWTGIDYLGEAGKWPKIGGRSGIIDSNGLDKPSSYLYKSFWSDIPVVRIAAYEQDPNSFGNLGPWSWPQISESWTYPEKSGQNIDLVTYTNCDSVELFISEKSVGVKYLKDYDNWIMKWNVPYEAGTIRAVGKKNGVEVTSFDLKTAGTPAKIILKNEKSILEADGRDVSNVEVYVVDTNGTIVPNASNLLNFSVSGKGKLIGIGNGDLYNTQSFKGTATTAFKGKALAIVQSDRESGTIQLNVSAEGLEAASVDINVK